MDPLLDLDEIIRPRQARDVKPGIGQGTLSEQLTLIVRIAKNKISFCDP